jgi:hypothetical protein
MIEDTGLQEVMRYRLTEIVTENVKCITAVTSELKLPLQQISSRWCWQRYITLAIKEFLHFVYCLALWKNTRLQKLCLRKETDPVSEALCSFIILRRLDSARSFPSTTKQDWYDGIDRHHAI